MVPIWQTPVFHSHSPRQIFLLHLRMYNVLGCVFDTSRTCANLSCRVAYFHTKNTLVTFVLENGVMFYGRPKSGYDLFLPLETTFALPRFMLFRSIVSTDSGHYCQQGVITYNYCAYVALRQHFPIGTLGCSRRNCGLLEGFGSTIFEQTPGELPVLPSVERDSNARQRPSPSAVLANQWGKGRFQSSRVSFTYLRVPV